MNRYRVTVRDDRRSHRFDVDASTHGTAIKRALDRIVNRNLQHVSVACTLMVRNIVRARIEKHSHGRVLESGKR